MAPPSSSIARGARWGLKAYRRLLSPWLAALGVRCRFEPSCSAYALDAFACRTWPAACGLTLWRLLRCGPWTRGGCDPLVPPVRTDCR